MSTRRRNMNTRKITILHSNDMHGDFLPEAKGGGGMASGGLAMLAGYVSRVRREEENALFVVSGDMVQGSMIDSEYKGISTIEIMNYLSPDVVTLGNHEFDYGLPHLLFLEKMANFPIVNANLYIKPYNKRLMKPYHIIEVAGLSILFIGIITDKIIASISTDQQISSFISLAEASAEIGKDLQRLQERRYRPDGAADPHRPRVGSGARGDAEARVGSGLDHRRPLPHGAGPSGPGQRYADRSGRHRHGPDRQVRPGG
jgi:2',3'-cyclic-nucleotide 2'-phosphodiesterase (5'-nucleotidase family)